MQVRHRGVRKHAWVRVWVAGLRTTCGRDCFDIFVASLGGKWGREGGVAEDLFLTICEGFCLLS